MPYSCGLVRFLRGEGNTDIVVADTIATTIRDCDEHNHDSHDKVISS